MPEASSPVPQDIDQALLALQLMNLTVKKTAEGALRAGKADKYADLGEFNRVVLTALNGMGVIWTCRPTMSGENFVLAYSLKHVPSGTAMEGEFPIPKGEPQKMGSAITYGRRYALGAVTGVAAEGDDDDGQGGRGRPGYAQRQNIAPQPPAERAPTAQRGRPAERSRPEREPEPPEPRQQRPVPTVDGEPHRGRGGLITQAMVGKLIGDLKKAGLDDARHKQFIGDVVGRRLNSRNDLTFDEGKALIDAIDQGRGQPREIVAAYRATMAGGDDDAPPVADPPTSAAPARGRGRTKPAETRPVAEQTRDAVLGRPSGPNDEAPPWETEPERLVDAPAQPRQVDNDGWPETATPGGAP